MRYSYGIMDGRRILLYHPQLFLKENDILVFPSEEFHQWHGTIKEYIDGLYQINAKNMLKSKYINITMLNLAMGVLDNITEELEHLFDCEKTSNPSPHYVSTLEEKYKKRSTSYTSDMRRCDIRIPVITPTLKYRHIMEIIRYAEIKHEQTMERHRLKGIKK